MDYQMENTLRESQLASLGKLLSGYTHELKNHLAIINESSGLMGDLLDMVEGEDDKTHQRFKKIITTINERIFLANAITKHLNGLAHRMDIPTSVFNLNDLLSEVLTLVDRFARLKSISLGKNFQHELPSCFSNPSLLQFIVFSLVIEFIRKLSNGGSIQVLSQKLNEDIEVTMEAIGSFDNSAIPDDSGQMSAVLAFAVEKMDIDLKREAPGPDRLKITLSLAAL